MPRRSHVETAIYREVLIACGLLKTHRLVHYSSKVPSTRWGEAIARLLSERGWTKRQLADAASVRPNTITNLIKHGKDSDTATLSRIAAAFRVDIAELFLTREQSAILNAHRASRIDQLRDMVVKEVTETVTRLVAQQIERGNVFADTPASDHAERTYSRRKPKTVRRKQRE